MTDLVKYKVTRVHLGDDYVETDGVLAKVAKSFAPGDIRTGDPVEVRHLVEMGLLVEQPPLEKADAPVLNKADAVPSNKRRRPAAKKKA